MDQQETAGSARSTAQLSPCRSVADFNLRDAGDGSPVVMHGYFSVFNQWTEIRSAAEGHFLERIAPGAFSKTIAERGDQVRVLFQHGKDPMVGQKPLGKLVVLEERDAGAYYEVELFDTEYVRELLPALRAGQLGASFQFRTVREDVDTRPQRSSENPSGLTEVTIREAKLFELGPVTFGAYPNATSGVRSLTDEYIVDSLGGLEAAREIVARVDSAMTPGDGDGSNGGADLGEPSDDALLAAVDAVFVTAEALRALVVADRADGAAEEPVAPRSDAEVAPVEVDVTVDADAVLRAACRALDVPADACADDAEPEADHSPTTDAPSVRAAASEPGTAPAERREHREPKRRPRRFA